MFQVGLGVPTKRLYRKMKQLKIGRRSVGKKNRRILSQPIQDYGHRPLLHIRANIHFIIRAGTISVIGEIAYAVIIKLQL